MPSSAAHLIALLLALLACLHKATAQFSLITLESTASLDVTEPPEVITQTPQTFSTIFPSSTPRTAIPTIAVPTIRPTLPSPQSTTLPNLIDLLGGLNGLTACATGCLGNILNVVSIALSDKISEACLDPSTPTILENCRRTCPSDNSIFNTIQSYCATVPKPAPLPTARVVTAGSLSKFSGLMVTGVAGGIFTGVAVIYF
ncbi:hypothetical protein BC829DRAFT_288164 [Chytridium lagenaria]|nr:hypothetical protein BC829DRAFT_288164 [Chytridium lagenaria]